jgi:glycosyltransferase involved in cell wall biosynthesis
MAGLPVAASDLPEIRRVARDGDPPVGELFDPTSSASIAAAVGRILADPAEYQARRREARRLALERFNWQIEEPRLLSLYGSVGERVKADA